MLRPFEPGDLAALHDIHSREPEMVRWLYEDAARTLEDDRAAARAAASGDVRFALSGDALGFAAVRDGAVVGDLSLIAHQRRAPPGRDRLRRPPRPPGPAATPPRPPRRCSRSASTRSACTASSGALEARNVASARVLEKLGMRREAHLVENELVKGEWQSELRLRRWRQSQPRRLK